MANKLSYICFVDKTRLPITSLSYPKQPLKNYLLNLVFRKYYYYFSTPLFFISTCNNVLKIPLTSLNNLNTINSAIVQQKLNFTSLISSCHLTNTNNYSVNSNTGVNKIFLSMLTSTTLLHTYYRDIAVCTKKKTQMFLKK